MVRFFIAFKLLAREIQATLKMLRLLRGDQHLADHRDAGEGEFAQDFFAGGHHTPGQHFKLLPGQGSLQRLLAGAGFRGQEDDADSQAGLRRGVRGPWSEVEIRVEWQS